MELLGPAPKGETDDTAQISEKQTGGEQRAPSAAAGHRVLHLVADIAVMGIWIWTSAASYQDHPQHPVEFSGENATLADKNPVLLSGYDTTISLTSGARSIS